MGSIIGGLLSFLGSGISGFFGFKRDQINTVNNAIETIGSAQMSDANYAQASAQAITALYESGPPFERLWRPALMWICMGLVIARWFGYTPGHISTFEIEHMYTWLEIGLIGYMPLRSIDKWMRGFQIGKVLQTMIEKKLG